MSEQDERVALVTGAASGIGRASAMKLAASGITVMLADRDVEGMKAVATDIEAMGTGVSFVKFDALSREDCQRIVRETIQAFGRLDILCNIAGIAGSWRLENMPVEDWDRMMDINLNSLFHITQAALPHLVESKGNIVNMSSASGKQGQPYNACYGASKAAVIGFTRAVAAEFASRGVRSNAICPGGVRTAIYDNYTFPEDAEMNLVDRMLSLPNFGEAEAHEIAAMVAYLSSSEARFITGVAYSIDGGQTAL